MEPWTRIPTWRWISTSPRMATLWPSFLPTRPTNAVRIREQTAARHSPPMLRWECKVRDRHSESCTHHSRASQNRLTPEGCGRRRDRRLTRGACLQSMRRYSKCAMPPIGRPGLSGRDVPAIISTLGPPRPWCVVHSSRALRRAYIPLQTTLWRTIFLCVATVRRLRRVERPPRSLVIRPCSFAPSSVRPSAVSAPGHPLHPHLRSGPQPPRLAPLSMPSLPPSSPRSTSDS